ncbi:hypothetical protein BJ684DRAFT_18875 [Piptocephalis cylindrospora]|uniref:Uncharacterized protein n=1 Tax=Piptocephalis cylindrospora TaxID=1907219 RepID=A0A4V1IYJ1_9FUNG|nr:hypothetical protein BJ684DRAFT_18875 [Piptocephalis cylindrospora]|eukprot:RKP14739.1 hypothetical protein BJ684DRAFT_18875 [Piptocephalis cylindrospora]
MRAIIASLTTFAVMAMISAIHAQEPDLPLAVKAVSKTDFVIRNLKVTADMPDAAECRPGNPDDRDSEGNCNSNAFLDKIDHFSYNRLFGLWKDVNAQGKREFYPNAADTMKSLALSDDQANITLKEMSDQLPRFAFHYSALKVDAPLIGQDTLYVFQMEAGAGTGNCVASRGVEGDLVMPYSQLFTRRCDPGGLPSGNDWVLGTRNASDPIRQWLSTVFVETDAGKGYSHINSVGDMLYGYWSCVDDWGRAARCSSRMEQVWYLAGDD